MQLDRVFDQLRELLWQLTVPEIVELFFENQVRFFGIPKIVLHDCDAHFTAAFWKALWSIVGMQTVFNSMYHI